MANEDREADGSDCDLEDDLDGIPDIDRMQYYILDPKARAPMSLSATPSPMHNATTIKLLRDIHGLLLNLARTKKGVAHHAIIRATLKNNIKVKYSSIAVLNDHVKALQAQSTILLRINKDLSDEAPAEKKEKERQTYKMRSGQCSSDWILVWQEEGSGNGLQGSFLALHVYAII
jgi:hypothetical protein